MKTTIKLEGMDTIIRELKKRGMSVTNALTAITLAGAEVIKDAAIEGASGISSDIADSIEVEILTQKGQRVTVGVAPDKNKAWYAGFVEFGTQPHVIIRKDAKALRFASGEFVNNVSHPGTAAQPFMRPAFDEHSDKAKSAMGNETKKVLGL